MTSEESLPAPGAAHRVAVDGGLFRGWYIVAFTFVMQFVVMGLVYYSFGVYLKPLSEALAADRFSISLTLSMEAVVVALIAPYVSRQFADRPIRRVLFTGLAALTAGFLLMSQISTVWQLYLVYGGVIAVGLVSLTALPSNLLLTNWFERRRGTAMGISQFGISISAAVLVPVVTWLLLTWGWRIAFAVCGAGAFLILAPLIWAFAVKTPEELGLFPDGEGPRRDAAPLPRDTWTFRRAVVDRDVWLITVVIGCCNMGIASVLLSLPAHATDLGISPMRASGIVALTAVLGACAKIVFGILADHLPKKAVVATAVLFQALGVATLVQADSYPGLLVAAVLFGFGYGGTAPLWAILLATRFGRASFPTIMGANMPMLMPFALVALPLTNWLFETRGSYLPAFALLSVAYLAALVGLALLRLQPPAP